MQKFNGRTGFPTRPVRTNRRPANRLSLPTTHLALGSIVSTAFPLRGPLPAVSLYRILDLAVHRNSRRFLFANFQAFCLYQILGGFSRVLRLMIQFRQNLQDDLPIAFRYKDKNLLFELLDYEPNKRVPR